MTRIVLEGSWDWTLALPLSGGTSTALAGTSCPRATGTSPTRPSTRAAISSRVASTSPCTSSGSPRRRYQSDSPTTAAAITPTMMDGLREGACSFGGSGSARFSGSGGGGAGCGSGCGGAAGDAGSGRFSGVVLLGAGGVGMSIWSSPPPDRHREGARLCARNVGARDLLDVQRAHLPHDRDELVVQDLEHAVDAGLAERGEPPHIG